jgi:hypothetical protein
MYDSAVLAGVTIGRTGLIAVLSFNNEPIAHFLLHCPMYRAQRSVLRYNVTKIAGRSASPLNLDVLLDQPKCTPSTLVFVDAVKFARKAI